MKDLNNALTNMSHIVGKQIHVVRAQLDEIYPKMEDNIKGQDDLKEELSRLAYKMSYVTEIMANLNYKLALNRMLHAMEAGIENGIRSADSLLDAVHVANRNQIHLSLLTLEQAEVIFRAYKTMHRDSFSQSLDQISA